MSGRSVKKGHKNDMLYIGAGIIIVLLLVGAFALYYKKKEGFFGATNDVYSEGAKTGMFAYVEPNKNTLVSETCVMPDDFGAAYLPRCELMPDLLSKTACYFQCVGSYPGGIRGKCYPNILQTYNRYANSLGNASFPMVAPARCDQDDPCCFKNINTEGGLFDFLSYDLY
jgi:hypothetical protein